MKRIRMDTRNTCRTSVTGSFLFSGNGNDGYRMPVSMEIFNRTVSPLRIVTVAGSSPLPPMPW
jgi:hypothetical protein